MTNLSEIQISGTALRRNLALLRSIAPSGCQVAAVVKGNAYGHGFSEVVRSLAGAVDYFQVDDVEELRALRSLTKTPALVLGYVPSNSMAEVLELGAEIGVWDEGQIQALARATESTGVRAVVHVKIDALLGRLGAIEENLPAIITELKRHPRIHIVGVYGHFANIEDTTDLTHAHAQVEVFDRAIAKSQLEGVRRHISATSGLLTIEQMPTGNALVRLGIGVYGIYPSTALARTYGHLDLQPTLRWVTHLAQVKTLPPRHPIGYGLTFMTARETRIGIVPQGYSDGYDRGLSNTGEVLVDGARCPVLGRIAMNMFAVDLTNAPNARLESEVVLMGRQGEEAVTPEEIAAKIGTIPYEVTARISPLIPRKLTD